MRALAAALLLAGPAAAQTFTIPAASMEPTLRVGDVVTSLRSGTPDLGAVITFRHPVTDVAFAKRVVGLGGDVIEMRGGVLHRNGAPVRHDPLPDHVVPKRPGPTGAYPLCGNDPVAEGGDCAVRRLRETLAPGVSYEVLDLGPGRPYDDVPPVTVPEGHLFVMGDHRDNSLDSRAPRDAGGIGPVPVGHVVGRIVRVLFSTADPARGMVEVE